MKPAVINNEHASILPFKKVTESFFLNNTPDSVKYLFWRLFQCYVLKDCNTKAEVPDKEVALFYDQLMDLVAAAYVLHQADERIQQGKEGAQHA